MNTLELKNNFHLLIDDINNDALLAKFYSLMRRAKDSPDGRLWKNLTAEEKEELMLAYDESENEENLIAHSEIKKKHAKWLL